MESSKPFYVKRTVQITILALAFLLLTSWTFCLDLSAQHSETPPSGEQGQAAQHHGGSPWSLVFKWINFVILFGGLGWKLRKPLLDFLDSRRSGIEEGLSMAAEARSKAQSKLVEMESRLAGMTEDIRQLKVQALQQAEEERVRILEGARVEAQKILEMASLEIEGIRKEARLELKGHVAELAVQIAEQRLKSAIGPEEHKKIMERFVQGLGSSRN
jgi:F-type H+-transporting ATPase subunit b